MDITWAGVIGMLVVICAVMPLGVLLQSLIGEYDD